MTKRKILDVVIDCMNKGIDSKPVIEDLRSKGQLTELPRSKNNNFEFDHNNSQRNEISNAEWDRLEREYMDRKFGDLD